MAEENKFKVDAIKELYAIARSVDNADLKNFALDLADHIAPMEDAQVKKTIYATLTQGGTISRGLSRTMLSLLPENSQISQMVLGEKKPQYVVPDKKSIGEMFKETGGESVIDVNSPKFYGRNEDITRAKVRAIAHANGMTEEELWRALQEEATKESRRKIARGEDVGGWFDSPRAFASNLFGAGLGIVMPRTRERIESGEDVTAGDVGLDVGENILYGTNPLTGGVRLGLRALGRFAPRAAEAAGRFGERRIVQGLGTIGDAAANPVLMETADKIIYDEGDRARFNAGDVGLGTATNLTMPFFLRRQLSKGRRLFGSGEKEAAGATSAEGSKTYGQFVKETEKKISDREKAQLAAEKRRNARIFGNTKNVKALMTEEERRAFESASPIATENATLNHVATEIAKIAGRDGVSLDEATQIFFKGMRKNKREDIYSGVESVAGIDERFFFKDDKGRIHPTDQLQALIESSDWAPSLTPSQFVSEEAQKAAERRNKLANIGITYGANKYGDVAEYNPFTMLPFLDVEDQKKKREEEMKKEAERRAMQAYIFGGAEQ